MGGKQSTQIRKLLPRLRAPTMLHKLKRTLGRQLRRWRTKRQKTVTSASLLKTAMALRRSYTGLGLLRPMPRCSSFGSRLTLAAPLPEQLPLPLPAPPTPAATKRRQKQQEAHYAEWKSLFEQSSDQRRAQPAGQRPRVHNISAALAGQLTPRGFPSHTDKRRCAHTPSPTVCKVRRRLSLRLPMLSVSSSAQRQQLAKEAQLQKDLKDLKDYYGGVYYM